MTQHFFEKQTSIKHKIKRFFYACLTPLLKFSLYSGILFYCKENSKTFLSKYFDLSLEKEKLAIITENAQKAGENFSLLSPSKISEYVSNMTSSAFAQAKYIYLEKSVSVSSAIINSILWIIWICLLISLITSCIEAYKEKEQQNDIANLVVEKLLPFIKNTQK